MLDEKSGEEIRAKQRHETEAGPIGKLDALEALNSRLRINNQIGVPEEKENKSVISNILTIH